MPNPLYVGSFQPPGEPWGHKIAPKALQIGPKVAKVQKRLWITTVSEPLRGAQGIGIHEILSTFDQKLRNVPNPLYVGSFQPPGGALRRQT